MNYEKIYCLLLGNHIDNKISVVNNIIERELIAEFDEESLSSNELTSVDKEKVNDEFGTVTTISSSSLEL